MSNNELIKDLSKIEALDRLDWVIDKMEFVLNAVYIWDNNRLDFTDRCRTGFSLISDDIILDLKEISTIINDKRV